MTPDRLALVGTLILVLGLALWSVPLAIVVAGAIMLAIAVAIEAGRVIAQRRGGPGE